MSFVATIAILAAVTAAPVQEEEVQSLEIAAVETEEVLPLLLEDETPAAVEEIVFEAEVADSDSEASSEE